MAPFLFIGAMQSIAPRSGSYPSAHYKIVADHFNSVCVSARVNVDEEIIYRIKKRHHVRSARLDRINELLDSYGLRFVEDFVAVAPPPERPE